MVDIEVMQYRLISKVDMENAQRIIDMISNNHLKIGGEYKNAQIFGMLEEITNVKLKDFSPDRIIDILRGDEIIDPLNKDYRQRGESYLYSYEDTRQILMALYIASQNVKPQVACTAAAIWSNPQRRQPKVSPTINEWNRGLRWLSSRLLAAMVCLSIDSKNPPRDSFYICRRAVGVEKGQKKLHFYRLDETPHPTPGKEIFGISMDREEGEIFSDVEDYSGMYEHMTGKTFFGIQINAPNLLKEPAEIIIGVPERTKDPRVQKIIRAVEGVEVPEVSNSHFEILSRIMEFMLAKMTKMPLILRGVDARYNLPESADYLQAMITAMLSFDSSWSTCAFFKVEGNEILRLRSHSPGYNISETALTLEESNLESWVFRTEQPVIFNEVQFDDPRIPISGRHVGTNPFILVPAISIAEKSGIFFLTKERNSDISTFGEHDVAIAKLMAGILSEACIREKIATLSHIVSEPVIIERLYSDRESLKNDLKELMEFEILGEQEAVEHDPDEYFVLFCVRIESEATRSAQIWYDEMLAERIRKFLSDNTRGKRFSNQLNIKLYQIAPGKLVALLKSMTLTPNFPDLRRQLQYELLESCKAFKGLEAHLWSVQFTYMAFHKLLIQGKPQLVNTIDGLASSVIKKYIYRALEKSKDYAEADKLLKKGEYRQATRLLLIDLDEKIDAYALRHLSEASAGQPYWKEAEVYADKAILADKEMGMPGYAGSYLRKAEALIGQNEIEQGLEWFRKADDLSNEMKYKRALAKALITHGNEDEWYEGAILVEELVKRQDIEATQKSLLYLLQASAFKKSGRVPDAEASIKLAREQLPENPIASLEFIN